MPLTAPIGPLLMHMLFNSAIWQQPHESHEAVQGTCQPGPHESDGYRDDVNQNAD
jgi:hypothetical protein